MDEVSVNESGLLSLIDKIVGSGSDGDVLSLVAELRGSLAGQLPSIVLQAVVLRKPKFAHQVIFDDKNEPYYTFADFMAALGVKMGRMYGYKVGYVTATSTTPECRVAKNEDFQKWQRTSKVPPWAYEQINQLVFTKRVGKGGPTWTTKDYEDLVTFYKSSDPPPSNADLAAMCTERFGREINEPSIKGALDRLRKAGRLPKYR